MRESLKELRHAGLPPGFKDHAALMAHTLGCIHDTPEELAQRLEELRAGLRALDELDPTERTRHATAAMSRRCMQVVERKLSLLSDVIRRVDAFKDVSARKSEVLQQIAAGQHGEGLVGIAAGFLQNVKRCTHQGGSPEDAIKLEFERFVASFGLPKDHLSLRRAKEMFLREERSWGEAVLQESELVASFFRQRDSDDDMPARTIKRMIDTAVILGFHRNGEHLSKAWLLSVRCRELAAKRRVRRESQAPLQPSEEGFGRSRPVRVKFSGEARAAAAAAEIAQAWTRAVTASGSASKDVAKEAEARAARAETELKRAKEFGVPQSQLEEEVGIVADLRSEGVRWLAIAEMSAAVRNEATVVQAASPRSLERQRAAADRIDEACKAAVDQGVSLDHPNLREAWKMAKTVVADVGFQKRLENSEANARRRLEAQQKQQEARGEEAAGDSAASLARDAERQRVLAELRRQLLAGAPLVGRLAVRGTEASTAPCSRNSDSPVRMSARRALDSARTQPSFD